jgi:hypothetical protein
MNYSTRKLTPASDYTRAVLAPVRRALWRWCRPPLCENIVLWAGDRGWPTVRVHDAYAIEQELPMAISTSQLLRQRFAASGSLGFPAQSLVCIPNAQVCGEPGFVRLEEGAWLVEGNWRASNVIEHPFVFATSVSKRRHLKGDWYSIRSYWSDNYHHWHWDDLPRLLTVLPHLPDTTRFFGNDPLLEFQRASLRCLGITEDRIVTRASDVSFVVERLWFATPLGHSEWASTAPDVALKLRDMLVPDASGGAGTARRIYITRSRARYRRLLNEAELLPSIQDFGFEVVAAEHLSYRDQIGLFSGAGVVLGLHGAGLTNILFCRPNSVVLEILEPKTSRPHYWMMARALGHTYDCVVGDSAGGNVKELDVVVDRQALDDLICKHLASPVPSNAR